MGASKNREKTQNGMVSNLHHGYTLFKWMIWFGFIRDSRSERDLQLSSPRIPKLTNLPLCS